ncbi:MAG TPA: phosphoenolpyruvate hydrolase family protein [Planctomycetota bacterium]|nr:phosphoenolpyruvate hydrolase family protein [Planctomycetota bacterium]
MPRTTRAAVLAKLRAKVARRLPIFIASAGSGLVARLLEQAGADCINTFPGARLRANGMGTMAMMWPILDSNRQTLEYTEQDILPALKGQAFVCACLNANDPLRDMRAVLERCKAMGVVSVSNIGPSIGYVDKGSTLHKVLVASGITFEHEIEMLALARELELVTVGLAFDLEDSLALVERARPDLFCFHAGTTRGGLRGFDSGETIEQTAARTEEVYRAVRAIAPETLLIAHGAAMETVEDAQVMLARTSGHGFWTGSSTERIPIERAVLETAGRFAALRFGGETQR